MRAFVVMCWVATTLAAPQGYKYNPLSAGHFGPNSASGAGAGLTNSFAHEGPKFLQEALQSTNLKPTVLDPVNPVEAPQATLRSPQHAVQAVHQQLQQQQKQREQQQQQQHQQQQQLQQEHQQQIQQQHNQLQQHQIQQQHQLQQQQQLQQEHQQQLQQQQIQQQIQQQHHQLQQHQIQQQQQLQQQQQQQHQQQQHQQQLSTLTLKAPPQSPAPQSVAPILAPPQLPLQQQQQHAQQFGPIPAQTQPITNINVPAPIVTKDIFIHVAPQEAETPQEHAVPVPLAPPRKHYRIVFIKAPTPNIGQTAVRVSQAPVEEKTIIYVLTKKTDPVALEAALQEMVASRQPSKPEVYFIKYKSDEEAQHAQRTIQAQYDRLGGTTNVSDEGVAPVTSVIGALNLPTPQHQPEDVGTVAAATSISGNSIANNVVGSGSSSSDNTNYNYLPPVGRL